MRLKTPPACSAFKSRPLALLASSAVAAAQVILALMVLVGVWENESAVVVTRVFNGTVQVGGSRRKREMQERERTLLDLTSLSVYIPYLRGSSDDVSCQVDHAEPMMPAQDRTCRQGSCPQLNRNFNRLTNVDLQFHCRIWTGGVSIGRRSLMAQLRGLRNPKKSFVALRKLKRRSVGLHWKNRDVNQARAEVDESRPGCILRRVYNQLLSN
jgi:hypothetical protein